MRTTIIDMTQRELVTFVVVGAVTCFGVGVALALTFVALVSMPTHDAETLRRVETAYARGAMIKIASRPTKCRDFILENGVARCVS